jgi:hypothetical protein
LYLFSFSLSGCDPSEFRWVGRANTAGTIHSGTHKVSGKPEHNRLG